MRGGAGLGRQVGVLCEIRRLCTDFREDAAVAVPPVVLRLTRLEVQDRLHVLVVCLFECTCVFVVAVC